MAYGELGSLQISAQSSLGTTNTGSLRAISITKENLDFMIAGLKEGGMYARFGESPRHQGERTAKGSFDFEPQPTNLGAVLYAACGRDSVTSGTGIQTHKFRPLDTADWDPIRSALPPYTMLIDRNVNTSSVMSLFDMVCDGLDLTAKNGELLKGVATWMGGAYQEVARVAPTYPFEKPFIWNAFSGTYAGADILNIRDLKLSLKNMLEPVFIMGNSVNPFAYKRKSQPEVSGSLTLLFQSNSLMLNFNSLPASEAQLKLQWTSLVSSPAQLIVDIPRMRIDTYKVNITGPSLLEVTATFWGQYDTTSSYQLEYTLVNTQAVYP